MRQIDHHAVRSVEQESVESGGCGQVENDARAGVVAGDADVADFRAERMPETPAANASSAKQTPNRFPKKSFPIMEFKA